MKRKKNCSQNKMLSAKDIMEEFSLSYQSLNHYTYIGLLPVLVKKGNMRFYDADMVRKRLVKARELMGEGYSLQLIRKKLLGI